MVLSRKEELINRFFNSLQEYIDMKVSSAVGEHCYHEHDQDESWCYRNKLAVEEKFQGMLDYLFDSVEIKPIIQENSKVSELYDDLLKRSVKIDKRLTRIFFEHSENEISFFLKEKNIRKYGQVGLSTLAKIDRLVKPYGLEVIYDSTLRKKTPRI